MHYYSGASNGMCNLRCRWIRINAYVSVFIGNTSWANTVGYSSFQWGYIEYVNIKGSVPATGKAQTKMSLFVLRYFHKLARKTPQLYTGDVDISGQN